MYIVKNLFKRVVAPYVDIARLEGKVIIKVWSNGAKRKENISLRYFEDNAIDGQRLFGVKLSIDEKVIAKPEQLQKRKQKKKHPNVLILHFKKMDRNNINFTTITFSFIK
jgi:ribonuclease-3